MQDTSIAVQGSSICTTVKCVLRALTQQEKLPEQEHWHSRKSSAKLQIESHSKGLALSKSHLMPCWVQLEQNTVQHLHLATEPHFRRQHVLRQQVQSVLKVQAAATTNNDMLSGMGGRTLPGSKSRCLNAFSN